MVMSPVRLENKDHCAGEGQQQFSSQPESVLTWHCSETDAPDGGVEGAGVPIVENVA
jgi:hypothetical protein